jgi:hypothetical protein
LLLLPLQLQLLWGHQHLLEVLPVLLLQCG